MTSNNGINKVKLSGFTTNQILNSLPQCAYSWKGLDYDGMTHPKVARVEQKSHGVLIVISAENGDGVAEYYQDMYVHPELEAWARRWGSYVDWESAGAVSVFVEGVRS